MYCKKCETEKPADDFYPAQKTECKKCTKKRVREYRRKNIERIRAYDRGRGSRQDYAYVRAYRQKNPEKYQAHNAVNNAIRDGRIKKEKCFMCAEENTVGHHPDYSKPLAVIWLCQGCHKLIHAYEERAELIRREAQ